MIHGDEIRALWQHVVLQAIVDALGDPMARSTAFDRRLEELERHQADMWLRGRGRDFRYVCQMAGFDPDFIADRYEAGQIDADALRWRHRTSLRRAK